MEVRDITPALAKQILARNKGNRNPSPHCIRTYADTMLRGKWMLTSQGITLSESGNLLDGQNRLHAVVQSGVTIKTPVFILDGHETAMGVPFDRGKTRSVSEVTGIPARSVQIANFLMRTVTGQTNQITDPSLAEEFYRSHSRAFAWSESALTATARRSLSEASVRSALMVLSMSGIDASEQYNHLVNLKLTSLTESVNVLYRYLTTTTDRNESRRIKSFCLAYRCFNPDIHIARLPTNLDFGNAISVIEKDAKEESHD
jgi:hypothetical protein